MALKWIFWDDSDLAGFIRRELHSKSTLDRIVIELEREIRTPDANSLDGVRSLVEQMLSDHYGMMDKKITYDREIKVTVGEAEMQRIIHDVSIKLRQEIHEEISRSQVDLDNKFKNNLQEIDGRIQKLKESIGKQPKSAPIISSPVDLTPIQNAIKQIQATQQQIVVRLGQAETKLSASQPAVVPVGGSSGISQAQFDAQNREIEALRKNFAAQSQNYANLKSDFDIQARENATLKKTISQQEQQLLKLEEKKTQQTREISDIKVQLESLQKIVHRLVTPPPIIEPWIKSFSLSKSTDPKAFFHGSGANVKTKLAQSIQDMDDLITHLTQSKISEPARTSFMKNLRWCMEALEKLYGKFDFDGCDSEEISEEITGKFFKIISENLLDNVMVAIYRGGKDAVGYQEFLQNVNHYLSMHGIYTEDILPGTLIEGDMLSNIEPPISKQTSVATDDSKVDEVELLPYFMLYEDDDGNLETVRKRGRVVRLKYGA